MEIERKWITQGWPSGLDPVQILKMRQGYISTCPTVRIRSHQESQKPARYILCFKGEGKLSRKEIETEISKELFHQLEEFIAKPLIEKEQRRFLLPDGLVLEANLVDATLPSKFYYVEIEFETEQQAHQWKPDSILKEYLQNEVTYEKGQSMAEYWNSTRLP